MLVYESSFSYCVLSRGIADQGCGPGSDQSKLPLQPPLITVYYKQTIEGRGTAAPTKYKVKVIHNSRQT